MNTATINGYLANDPEITYLSNGLATATFCIASSIRWRDKKSGVWAESTTFTNARAQGDLAENIALTLVAGDRIICAGEMMQITETASDGTVRTHHDLVLEDLGVSLKTGTVDLADRR